MSSSHFSSPALPQVTPIRLGKSVVTSNKPLDDAKWIELRSLEWTDEDGKDRKWETVRRKTTNEAGVDAVAIAALLKHPSRPLSTVIILQYRPPIDAICVELPAGLIDANEGPEKCALRELHEETGYGGEAFDGRIKIVELGGVVPSDPGMSVANMHLATVEVELKEGEEEPQPKLESGTSSTFDLGEHIEVRVTPLAELYSHLKAFEKLGYTVDARLHHFAAGIELAKKYNL
ncbi:BQ2448_861 [Microbotryum intermedium]|uniref:BQ2448_861 protein n=1 Tax=Microbotryum intermedium TaxID=269621 RepID=A0A238F3Q7_9BASI|nr:BQ2448_861 [Microbotryum intermedium]